MTDVPVPDKSLPLPQSEEHAENDTVGKPLAQQVARAFSGPLPPPEVLAKYEDLQPGFAERIFSMAEREQGHRHKCEPSVLSQELRNHEARNREVFRGQLFGFLIGSIAIVSGSVIAAMGSQWSGGFIGGGGVIGLVAVFILGQHKHRADGNSGKGQSGA